MTTEPVRQDAAIIGNLKKIWAEQLLIMLKRVNEGIYAGMSASGIIEMQLGLGPGQYPQELRAELMHLTNAYVAAEAAEEDRKQDREQQKEWLRNKLCKKCAEIVEKGF